MTVPMGNVCISWKIAAAYILLQMRREFQLFTFTFAVDATSMGTSYTSLPKSIQRVHMLGGRLGHAPSGTLCVF